MIHESLPIKARIRPILNEDPVPVPVASRSLRGRNNIESGPAAGDRLDIGGQPLLLAGQAPEPVEGRSWLNVVMPWFRGPSRSSQGRASPPPSPSECVVELRAADTVAQRLMNACADLLSDAASRAFAFREVAGDALRVGDSLRDEWGGEYAPITAELCDAVRKVHDLATDCHARLHEAQAFPVKPKQADELVLCLALAREAAQRMDGELAIAKDRARKLVGVSQSKVEQILDNFPEGGHADELGEDFIAACFKLCAATRALERIEVAYYSWSPFCAATLRAVSKATELTGKRPNSGSSHRRRGIDRAPAPQSSRLDLDASTSPRGQTVSDTD